MEQTSGSDLPRRQFLTAGLGLAAASLWPGFGGRSWALTPEVALGRKREDRGAVGPCLVLVQLTGGNDGLDTVVPFADEAYRRARPTLALPQERVLPLDQHTGLHPNLERLHREYRAGRLGLVPGVGYPRPNRSHFMSFEIWHTGNEHGRSSGPGWIGRLMELLHGASSRANRVVHVGGAAPYSLQSARHPPVALTHPRVYRFAGGVAPAGSADADAPAHCEVAPAGSGMAERLAFLRGLRREAEASSAQVRAAVARHTPLVEYPSEPFAQALSTGAALIAANLGVEVLSVELGGFDTHVDQRRRHDQLLARLDAGLGAFLEELRGLPQAADTLVVVFSEFGRRVAENGSRGTDHGAAGPVFIAGPRARGGCFGEHPSLTDLVDGDLAHTTDFRSIYASAANALFGVSAEGLFGTDYPLLPLA